MVIQRTPPGRRRRGIVLLVVLSMLTLFAIIGLTFVLYAESEAESGRINRDAESSPSTGGPDMDPTTAFNLFMGQLVYGVDDTNGVYSALRGHSLAETMYGSFDANGPLTVPPTATVLTPNDVPYDGTGRLNEGTLFPGIPDSSKMVNYTYFASDGFLRDPSRLGTRAGVYLPSPPAAPNTPIPRGQYTGGQNAPYTYPDHNNMFLASINSSNGQVVMPSYYRPWLADWNSTQGKYTTLRPRPVDMGPGFPPIASPTGDVINLVGVSQQPDSMWIDIGGPVLTTAAGLRYKMLVAPLILDLDSRINLNVAGNVLASGNLHASNQGWGPWEVNMGKVLAPPVPPNPAAAANEWQNIFLGNPPTGVAPLYGRYGVNRLPTSTFPLAGATPHPYAPGDLDGLINQGASAYSVTGTGTGPYALPTLNNGFFTTFDPNAYLNGQMPEHQNAAMQLNHPMYYNPLTASAGNRLLPLSAHASLLWAGIAASPTSDLVRLCPANFNQADPTSIKRINQTTLLSMEIDRPGATPYIYDQTGAYAVAYNVPNPGQGAYTAGSGVAPQTFPTVSPARQGPPTIPGEFDPNSWRSVLAATLTRADLNRTLAAYPASGVQPPDRQQFATDIFTRLLAVTGMSAVYNNGNPGGATPPATPQQYATLRWLAQLSANIVDYIDTDDVMTVFQWASTPQGDTGYVFGTELPKLVVNEVYLEYNNDPADPATIPNPMAPPPTIKVAQKQYHVNVWAELLNPLPTTAELAPNPANNANLVNGGTPLYQLVITSPNKGLRNAANLTGDPDGANPGSPPFATQPYAATGTYSSAAVGGQVLAVVNNWGAVQNVTPVGTAQSSPAAANSNTGFLVVGPPNPTGPGAPAQIQTSVTANNMTYTVANGDAVADQPVPPTILLQRLANPNLAFNATTNPYVTVDYVDMQQVGAAANKTVVNDARQYNSQGINPKWVQNPNNRFSFGRNQPYAAVATAPTVATWQQQQAPAASLPLAANQPTTSFFAVNTATNPAAPPDWLVHLDRPLISPIELLHVSGFKPHELTQQFYKDAAGNFQNVAPWTNQNFLLYRLLEFVKTSNPTPGLAPGGRVPGKVNINTLDASTDAAGNPVAPEVFRALCDAQPGNSFSHDNTGASVGDAYVDQVFKTLMKTRTASLTGTPGPGDHPFWGMAIGPDAGDLQYPAPGVGIANTLLNTTLADGAGPYNGTTHPYQKLELLNKIFNNVTTRSNTFAVWLTVGFFQVTNDTVQPVKLGAEINAAQGKAIRHHMFAIVDRTQVQTFSTKTTAAIAANTTVAISPTIPNPVPDTRVNGPGRTWKILQGTTLVYDPGVYNVNPAMPNEETVVVQLGLTATFQYPHNLGAAVISRGHPGPWVKYDASQDASVVPYFVIID